MFVKTCSRYISELITWFRELSPEVSHVSVDLYPHQLKPSMKTRKNSQQNSFERKYGRNLGRSYSKRDPLPQGWLITRRYKIHVTQLYIVLMFVRVETSEISVNMCQRWWAFVEVVEVPGSVGVVPPVGAVSRGRHPSVVRRVAR